MKVQLALFIDEDSYDKFENFSIKSGIGKSRLFEKMVSQLSPLDGIKKESKEDACRSKVFRIICNFHVKHEVGITKVILARNTSKFFNGEYRQAIINDLIAQGKIKEISTIGRGAKPGTAYIPLQKYDDVINLQTY